MKENLSPRTRVVLRNFHRVETPDDHRLLFTNTPNWPPARPTLGREWPSPFPRDPTRFNETLEEVTKGEKLTSPAAKPPKA
ncbi:MAG: hypothetical protein QOI53_1444 [Verrucomicrobiota bacterium]|nr:hypothetical protein [Verrucomicrobiota bacterium]